jgi:predicted nucleotidyltransferase
MEIFPRNKTDVITGYLLRTPATGFRVSEVARALGVSKGSVSLTAKKMRGVGLLDDNNHINLENPLTKALKILISIELLEKSGAVALLRKKALSAGLYGSSAKGTDTENSDIDIWIVPRSGYNRIDYTNLSRELTEKIGRRVQITLLAKGRIDAIKRESINFYYSIMFGSITLFGDGIE